MITVGAIEMGLSGGNGTLVSVDRSASMDEGSFILASYLSDIIDGAGGRWACVSHSDYPIEGYLYGNGSYAIYGQSGDFAFELNSGWTTGESIKSVIGGLDIRYGRDNPECYTRVLWESAQSDTLASIGGVGSWLLMLLDDYPHWRGHDVSADPYVYTDGPDPGRSADGGGSFTYGGPNLDFLTDGIYAAQAVGWRVCVAHANSARSGFWELYADEVVYTDGSEAAYISQIIAILSS